MADTKGAVCGLRPGPHKEIGEARRDALLALADRVEQEAPSRELDAAVWRATNQAAHDRCYWNGTFGKPHSLPPYPEPLPKGLGWAGVLAMAPRYTGSLDAAVTLLPTDHGLETWSPSHGASLCRARVWMARTGVSLEARAATLPQTITAVCLLAIAGVRPVGDKPFWPLLPGTTGDALFCGTDHRIWLERRWGTGDDYALHIGMNPSYAGADRDDLTVRKDQEFTRRMGLDRMFKMNVGTLISTDPAGLSACGVVVCHPDNQRQIMNSAAQATRIIIATGNLPDPLIAPARNIFRTIKASGRRMECFGLTKDHWPKHSSRLGYDTALVEFVW